MFVATIEKRSDEDKIELDKFIEKLQSSQHLAYILLASNPFKEAIRYIRDRMKEHPKYDMLPILQRHRMYFEAKIKEEHKDAW